MALTAAKVLNAVEQLHKDRPFAEHPLWAGMMTGAHSVPQLQVFAKQFGILPLWNNQYHGPLYVICPDPKWREMLAEVVYEEGTGRLYADGLPHNQLDTNFGIGLGLTRKQMWATKYGPGALGIQKWFKKLCNKSFLEGVSCHMLAGESHGPGVFGKMAEMLQKKYKLSDQAVAFWRVHDTADEDHSGIGKKLLGDFAKTQKELALVIKTVEATVDKMFAFYDDMYAEMRKVENGRRPRRAAGKTAIKKPKRRVH